VLKCAKRSIRIPVSLCARPCLWPSCVTHQRLSAV
jgi:hypothetical protein